MNAGMVDTQVLSYALVLEPARDEKAKKHQRDCGALFRKLDPIRTSSLVVLELLRSPPHIAAKVRASGILEAIQTEAIDARIAEDAAQLLEAARGDKEICERCLNVKEAAPCKLCNQLVSFQQKTHDALIVATAARLHDVEVLYSYDPGVFELARFVKNLRVETPPNLDGPLFAKHPP